MDKKSFLATNSFDGIRSLTVCVNRLAIVLALTLGAISKASYGDSTSPNGTSTPKAKDDASQSAKNDDAPQKNTGNETAGNGLAIATFGNGCFWCTEAVFQRVKGVQKVVSGFMGGHVPNPTYEVVLTKKSGHAEVLQLQYDPDVVQYEKLLEIFWKTHDPTTLNRQGNDIGPQYRSVVFYHTEEQKALAEKYKKLLDDSKAFSKPIVTEITQAGPFYPADEYHQNYYNLNKNRNPYCKQIQFKLKKFRQVFPDAVDPEKDRIK